MLNVWPFFTYSLVTAITPGPNNILAMSHGMNYGYGRALRFSLGVCSGFFLIILGCCWLNAGVREFAPQVQPVLEWCGAVYIAWLAFKVATSRPSEGNEANDRAGSASAGFVLQFANIKVLLYGLTVASAFIVPAVDSILGFFLYSLAAALINLVCVNVWGVCGSAFQNLLRAWHRPFNIAMAVALLYSALSIVHII